MNMQIQSWCLWQPPLCQVYRRICLHAHAHTHTHTHLHMQIVSHPFRLNMVGENYLFKTRFQKPHSFACIGLLRWYSLSAVFLLMCWPTLFFHCLIKAGNGLHARIKGLLADIRTRHQLMLCATGPLKIKSDLICLLYLRALALPPP